MNDIEKAYLEIMRSEVFRLDGPPIDLPRALIRLSEALVDEYPDEINWELGEHEEADLGSLIVGAYWAMSAWHAGQSSSSYAALCALGRVFKPGLADGPQPETQESDAYQLIDEWCEANPMAGH